MAAPAGSRYFLGLRATRLVRLPGRDASKFPRAGPQPSTEQDKCHGGHQSQQKFHLRGSIPGPGGRETGTAIACAAIALMLMLMVGGDRTARPHLDSGGRKPCCASARTIGLSLVWRAAARSSTRPDAQPTESRADARPRKETVRVTSICSGDAGCPTASMCGDTG